MAGTKEELLALLERNRGEFLSGEEAAERLHISRTAVWKAVNGLRKDGYEINAVPNKGYSLSVNTDILSAQGISRYLNPVCGGLQLQVLPEVDSTNTRLKERAAAGAGEGTVIAAGSQTAGKGRLGRRFYSPSDTGIYLSLLLRPDTWPTEQAVGITTMAAVAACEAIEALGERTAQIKWVNDVFMDGKKVSGILTEASMGLENGHLEYVIVGIGFNAYPPAGGFPEELGDIAGAVFLKRESDGKNRLAAEFLNRFMAYYTSENHRDYVEEYRKRSLVTGKEILVLKRDGAKKAKALDVDRDCRLLVEYENGEREKLSSGEISVRLARTDG